MVDGQDVAGFAVVDRIASEAMPASPFFERHGHRFPELRVRRVLLRQITGHPWEIEHHTTPTAIDAWLQS